MPPLILSPSFNSTGSISAPPNLTISGIMSAASGIFSGNVGIGTSSPSNPLHVSGGQEWPAKFQFASDTIGLRSALLIQRSRGTVASPTAVSANTNLGGLSIGGYDGTSYSSGYNGGSELMAFASENWTSTSHGSYLTLSTTSDGSSLITERMRITSDGRVGIGTNSPTCSLDVQGSWSTGNGPFLQLKNTSGATPGSFGPGIILSNSVAGKSNFMIQQYQDASSAFSINKYDSPYTSYFAISQTGNVGIGTSSPSYKLDIAGNLRATQSSDITGSGDLYFTVTSTTATGNVIIDSASGYTSTLWYRNGGINKWFCLNNGVNNRYNILDADYNDGVYLAQNSTSWTSNSDLRLKDVQGVITGALDKVLSLSGVRYKWKREADNTDAKTRVGLIAQDVQAVLPEAIDDDMPDVIVDEETGKMRGGLGVRYTEVVPLLVNAIKELNEKLASLEARLAVLES